MCGCDEINFMPDESKPKKVIKDVDTDDLVCGFPPERFAEIDEDLLWQI